MVPFVRTQTCQELNIAVSFTCKSEKPRHPNSARQRCRPYLTSIPLFQFCIYFIGDLGEIPWMMFPFFERTSDELNALELRIKQSELIRCWIFFLRQTENSNVLDWWGNGCVVFLSELGVIIALHLLLWFLDGFSKCSTKCSLKGHMF